MRSLLPCTIPPSALRLRAVPNIHPPSAIATALKVVVVVAAAAAVVVVALDVMALTLLNDYKYCSCS